MLKIFISYRHTTLDGTIAEQLAKDLAAGGFEVFFDQELRAGSDWQEKLQHELEAADALIVLVSKEALASDMVTHEVKLAKRLHKRKSLVAILPVYVAFDGPLPWEWSYLENLQHVVWTFGQEFSEISESLLEPLREAEKLPRTKPPKPEAQHPDWTLYLEDLIDHTEHIQIAGISTGGRVKSASRYRIEQLYTPLRCHGQMLHDCEEGDRTLAFEARRVELSELLPQNDRLLIEGQPGAGKTTFLRFTACMLARDALGRPCTDGPSWCARYLGLEKGRLPVLVRLADLVPLLTAKKRGRRDDRRWLLDLLDGMSTENEHGISRQQWEKLLEGDDAVLLLDGLDEVADGRLRERVFEVFRDACSRWKCPIVVASRPIQTEQLREMGFRTATIEPFSDAEIATFIGHWVAALHETAPDELRGEAERYRAQLAEAIIGLPRVKRLATNPVMLTCLCVVHWNEGQLPEGRSRVYRAVLHWLIAARTELRGEEGFSERFAWRAFAILALAMMSAEGGKRSILDLEEAAVAIESVVQRDFPNLEDEDRRRRARRWLRFECLGSGIVEEVSGNRLRFWHLTFQEYLAALQLAWRGDEDDPAAGWWPTAKEHLADAQWRETIELLPGCLLDEGGEGRVDKLLDRVLSLRGEEPELAQEAWVAGVVGRLLQPLAAYGYTTRPEIRSVYEEALNRSLEIFEPEGASRVPVEVRIAAAEALGQGGDPRLSRSSFLAVPGLDGARLGRYPVTVEEYQRFVEHQGYEEDRFWSADGWRLRQEKRWQAPSEWAEQLSTPNRPVVRVSWYEAEAYCRWLSHQRGEEIRLPRGAEWEKAAMPAKGEYPWGEEDPDAKRANFGRNVGSPTPVGVYPAGNGPYGHCDLAGNVWEWCQDEEELSWNKGTMGRLLRGGAWGNPAQSLRAAVRYGFHPAYRVDRVGFRVLVSPPST